jgi:hypothetical protein
MTPGRLTDDRLAAGLRAHLPVAHARLHERMLAEITKTPQERRLPSILGSLTDADPMARRPMMLLVALVALALSVSVTAMAGALLREQRTLPAELFELPPDVSLRPPSPTSPATPSATRDVGEVAHGWPDTSENAAGVYSWDGSRCSSAYCVIGFMHNGYGSGDVEIRIEVAPGVPIADDGATPVTVAGHDGIHRRIDARLEEWIVDIEGTTIAIQLEARPGTSPTDLAEAHTIIESMRTEPQDNDIGFRLVFTLTTNDWDSG